MAVVYCFCMWISPAGNLPIADGGYVNEMVWREFSLSINFLYRLR